MGRVYKGQSDMDSYLEACGRALDLQKQLLSRLRGELPETLQAQRDKTAGICFEMAEFHKRARKFDKARRARGGGGGGLGACMMGPQ